MPFKLGTIAAKTSEAFKACEDALTFLNEKCIQTLNNESIEVNLQSSMLGIEVTPSWYNIKSVRIFQSDNLNWVDYDHEKECIWLNTKKAIFKINLKKDDKNA
jgi:hypothetical protein